MHCMRDTGCIAYSWLDHIVVGQATFCHFCNADSYDRLIFSLALYAVLLFCGNECYSQSELDGSTSWCYLLFSNFVHVWVHASEWKLLHLETRWHYKPFLWMWVLTTLVKVSNFTNEVYDLYYVSSIIAKAINCSEFWTHRISHLILV